MHLLFTLCCRLLLVFGLLGAAASVHAAEVDAVLEAELDRYILLMQQDRQAGRRWPG